jgi:protein-disulfide isomerase
MSLVVRFAVFAIVASLGMIQVSCTDQADAKPKFVFKPNEQPQKNVMAKMGDTLITEEDLVGGKAGDYYEIKKRLFDFRMDQLESVLLDRVIEKNRKEKDMSREEFLSKVVYNGGPKVSDSEVQGFIKERNIPKEQVNDMMKTRIRGFLESQKKDELETAYLAKMTQENNIEVYYEKPEAPRFEIPVEKAPSFGPKDAEVTIVEYSDFECPYCAKAASTMAELKKKYGNKVRFVFKHFPLRFHPNAKPASLAAECAQDQNKFWAFHDKLFENQDSLSKDTYMTIAKNLKLDMDKFKTCFEEEKHMDKVEADLAEVESKNLPVSSTPTFFVNGIKLAGAQPAAQFIEYIDQELEAAN